VQDWIRKDPCGIQDDKVFNATEFRGNVVNVFGLSGFLLHSLLMINDKIKPLVNQYGFKPINVYMQYSAGNLVITHTHK
jgi:hypothetical protein